MKHTLAVTLILVGFFFAAQVIGLAVTNQYIDHYVTEVTGNITFANLPYNVERPQVEESSSFAYIIGAVILGTALIFLIIKLNVIKLWKFWFLLSVFITLTISFAAFINQVVAVILALALGIWKIYRPNVIIHNLTELFIYGGLAAIFVPIMNLFAISVLLLLISAYDAYAVWKSKHMIKLAQAQTDAKIFAGLLIPYSLPKDVRPVKVDRKVKIDGQVTVKTAILGGGDIGFPLLFAGVVMKNLMLANTVGIGFLKSLVIPVFVSAALFSLLTAAQKDKFYPAMPFLTIGCFLGYLVLLIFGWV